MRGFNIASSCLIFLLVAGLQLQSVAADKDFYSTEPVTNNGKKWRIAYYEGGSYIDYKLIFSETVKSLMKMGWLEEKPLPFFEGEKIDKLWSWLATDVNSKYLDFVEDAYYSADWEEAKRKESVAAILNRLNSDRDIDLIIAMGTLAGKDLANNDHTINTMVVSASDAIGAGIIESVNDSGFDHVHAYVDPNRSRRQLNFFHEMIGFKSLGVIYENSVAGKSYAAIETVEKIAEERNFKIERCFAVSDVADSDRIEKQYIECFKKISKITDAVYLTYHGGLTYRSIPKIVAISIADQIPTFSQSGPEEVKYGVLLSLSQDEFRHVGKFHAETFAKVFNGAKPNELEQVFEEPKSFALNLKTAASINYDVPVDVIGAADQIFEKIISPSQ